MAFTRRSFLAGLMGCPFCAAAARGAEGAYWSYADVLNWGAHNPAYQSCATGGEQSPIDLTNAIRADIRAPKLSWKAQAFKIVNNGHTIQAEVAPGCFATLGNRKFEFAQFHFHTPSEHAIDGKRTAMEAHFVHAGERGVLLVLGALLKAGAKNKEFTSIMAAAPPMEGEAKLNEPVDPAALLPKRRAFFRYEGSLTTPPCSEVVNWDVFANPVEVAASDIEAFKKLFPMNARPLQSLRRRFVLCN
jgi:carbonic anhydrase